MASKEQKEIKRLTSSVEIMNEKVQSFKDLLEIVHNQPATDLTLMKLSLRLEQFKPINTKYEDLAIQLSALNMEINPSVKEFEEQYFDLVAQASNLLELNRINQLSNINTSINSTSNNLTFSNDNSNVKLPTLNVPSFNGTFSDWIGFFDTFTALIHNNPKLTDIEKFFYLQNSLKGSARELIQELTATSSNYEIAINMLKDRYHNEKLIIFSHLEGLFDIPKLNKESAVDLRKFYDRVTRHLRALDNMHLSDESFKAGAIAYIIKSKLDQRTAGEYCKFNVKKIPSITETLTFLSERCIMLEDVLNNQRTSYDNKPNSSKYQNPKGISNIKQSFAVTNSEHCPVCNANHYLYLCPKFMGYSVKQRFDKVAELRICKNCFRHNANQKCFSTHKCKYCQRAHNNLLCFFSRPKTETSNIATTADTATVDNTAFSIEASVPASLSCISVNSEEVLLSTALIRVKSSDGSWQAARCLLDSASQSNFITTQFCARIGSKLNPTDAIVYGINSKTSSLEGVTHIQIASRFCNFKTGLSCLVIPTISRSLPSLTFNKSQLAIPSEIGLADNNFNQSSPIDILIGASLFYHLLSEGQISLGKGNPTLQKTVLGWVISGNLSNHLPSKAKTNTTVLHSSITYDHQISNNDLDKSLTKFWSTESIDPINRSSLLSAEERFCQNHFCETITQGPDGRLTVSIPFKSTLSQLGESKSQALRRLYNLEKRFTVNPELREKYYQFMHDYIALGHMTRVDVNVHDEITFGSNNTLSTFGGDVNVDSIPDYFLPHHAICKLDSLTTRLRVVFDGSAKTESKLSLNQVQCVGPVIQEDLFSILLRFRQHKFALTGDVEKMYRMIHIHPHLRKFQRILWRENPTSRVETYELNTITYGTSSASYLATRCLQYLAELNRSIFPKACSIIDSSFYMDDLLYTSDSLQEIIEIKDTLIKILGSAGLNIRKFLSNNSHIMSESSKANTSFFNVPIGERSNAKALGLFWNSIDDTIHYNPRFIMNNDKITKRSILSNISQLFDPLGLLSPIIVKGKIFMQRLWELKVSWDEQIPELINTEWNHFKNELKSLNNLQISRCVKNYPYDTIELHGFADSSITAYGACIYVRTSDGKGSFSTNLLCTKSRIAPLRTMSIPRLELCAAVLLVQLMLKVKSSLTMKIDHIFLWTDSMIVLNWVNSPPNKFKTFIANRVAMIQEHFEISFWHHVQSRDNPADLISRGLTASEILTNNLWWHGPKFLTRIILPSRLQIAEINQSDSLELKSTSCVLVNQISHNFNLFTKYSTLTRLQRITAWCLRFIGNCHPSATKISSTTLTIDELNCSMHKLVKLCQSESFFNEIQTLELSRKLNPKCKILSLNPFLDNNKLLRVGGRIRNSNFHFDKKHPLLLPKSHPLTILIIGYYHAKLLHCGSQQLLSIIREQYWPISGKNTIKGYIRKCVKCFKVNPTSKNPIMGNLPTKRLEMNTPAFYNTGLDYAGPIMIRDRKTRGSKLIKAYICIFVCLVTRAIHLELVTDLTTLSFISTLKRFIARRGKPHSLSSDNAKNFVGAYHHLKELYKFLKLKDTQNYLTNYLNAESIKWEFITPRAPHQGGIWETGIKSIKSHLKKVLGNTTLCFEDFHTVLTQIEAVLNSRPLSCLSSDPEDINPLTPGHFLIGRSLCALPEPNFLPNNENRLSLYQRTQRIVQHFWKRWSVEIVPELQKRSKWFTHLPDLLQVGTLVLIREDNQPPLNWPLGRVLQIHRGTDGVIRSATLKTLNNIISRPVNKLCVLLD